jgi:pimeloyl-ACP methyl ester carboxylesterase
MMILLIIIIPFVFLALVYLGLSYFIAYSAVHQNRQPVPKNPGDYGMKFENAEFNSADGVKLKGWLIPGELNKVIVMTHVAGLTKYGSSASYKNPTKMYNWEIEFLKTAQHLHQAGYWVLLFDFRNHGESGPDPNKGMASIGLKEYQDVVAALKYIGSRDELKDANIGFASFCMGANSTIIAMSKNPEAFKKVKCLFLVQPISMEVFLRTYLGTFITLRGARLFMPMVKRFVVLMGAMPLEQMSPKDYAKDILVPAIYVQARNDPWTELSDIKSFYANTPDKPREFVWIENTKHRYETYSYFQNKPDIMMAWLKRWM